MSGTPDPALAVFHWIEYLGLLGGIGSFVVRRLGRLRPRIAWAEPQMAVAFVVAILGGLGLFALAPAWAVAARVLAEGAALVLCMRGIRFVAVFVAIAVLLLPITTHAALVGPDTIPVEFADALHIFSAGMWAGGILVLASLRPVGGWGGAEARMLLERFGRVAVIAFGVTALTGILRATEQLHGVSDLWSTGYGIVLALKSAGVLVMLTLSLAWRRGWPAARAEAAVAILVVGATAVLAAFPFPVGAAALSR